MPKTEKLVVLGNPPYQSMDGGHGVSAKPIYNIFIETIIDSLDPQYFSFIVPSRWMMGGKGLDKFRTRMMSDRHIKVIVDDMSLYGVFSSVDIAGGVNYFLRDKRYEGMCKFNFVDRYLDEYDIIIRENENRDILERVRKITEKNIGAIASPSKPYGLRAIASPRKPYGLRGDATITDKGIPCWFKQSIGKKFVDPATVKDPRNDINKWKVLAPRLPIAGQTDFTKPIGFFTVNNIIIAEPGEVCTETYLVLNAFNNKEEATNFVSYMRTKFFRFMLRMRVTSQNIARDCYSWVPDVGPYHLPLTDEKLYKMFNITRQQQDYIDSKIKELK